MMTMLQMTKKFNLRHQFTRRRHKLTQCVLRRFQYCGLKTTHPQDTMLTVQVLLALAVCALAQATKFTIENNSKQTLWIGILGNDKKAPLANGGFELRSGAKRTLDSPNNWAGRFWARTGCKFVNGQGHCETGDCGNKLECKGAGGAPPATLAEITLKGDKGMDFYDVSLVDGFNLPVQMMPTGQLGQGYSCSNAKCQADINGPCPEKLRLKSGGRTVGCKSACLAYNKDQDCCRGAFNKPETCPVPESAKYFKKACPGAYSYAYDDKKSTFTCVNRDYRIIFG